MVARESLVFAKELGLQKVHIEGDSQLVIGMIQKQQDVNTAIGVLITDVTWLRQEFEDIRVSFIRRIGNSASHVVAKDAMRGSGIRSWEFYPPPPPFFIHHVRMRAHIDVLVLFPRD
ncbi:hypothetical protein RHMOL_Rhmol04G0255500 [Rhododendron molle]|uniref:Uncharacterized protein n=1 Tax=Rhododendron molle TaxID=49168 RepID=A0ACC0P4H6_RHOML|nr:hypothetical protein RHMOL_Rhmol04G0255500 [Rhododendron molle]